MYSQSDYATEYQAMPDGDLVRLASEGGLVDEAKTALHAEMSKRNLTKDAVMKYQAEERLRTRQTKKEKAAKAGSTFLGTGFEFYGRAYLSEADRSRGIQVRTKWFVMRYTPIFPVASYRFECKTRSIGEAHAEQEKLLNQIPLNWKQVMTTYAKMIGVLILMVCAFIAWDAFRAWYHR